MTFYLHKPGYVVAGHIYGLSTSREETRACVHISTVNIQCKPGFTSMKGRPCYKCIEPLFGKKCSFKCNCSRSEICHNVNGCVAKTQKKSAVMSASFDTSTSKMGLYLQTSTGVRLTDDNIDWLTRDKLLMYIMCTGLCAVSIGLLVICRNRGTQFFYMLKMRRKTSVNSKLAIEVVNEEIFQMSGSIYDLVDDQNMLDNQERNDNN
ncbi:uncharacterized protein [Mytilus edulis]|uniref:uncharacterized protein n=1 Tax=Mytilus edulis TaxID=6550 RepID=UPI0039EF1274